jgi:hypothetical protein
VSQFHFAAVVAFDHARQLEFEVGAALVTAGFGRFTKRYCHLFHLLTGIHGNENH